MADDQTPEDDTPKPRASSGSGLSLSKRVGPLSVGSWLLVAAAGIALGLVVRRSGLFRPAAPAAPAPDPSTGAGIVPGSAVIMGQTAPLGTGTGAGATPAGPRDNIEWQRLALERLIASGQDVTASQQALALFLNGDPVTAQQAAIIAIAIRLVGPPPEYVKAMVITDPGGSRTPPPQPVPPTGQPVNVTSLSNPELLRRGNETLLAGQDWRPYEEEAIRRIVAGSLSVNDPAWKYPSGGPLDFWWPVSRQLFARGIAHW